MPKSVVDLVSEKAEALVGAPDDFNSLIDLIGDARFVLVGEASHGTDEFYRIRAQISKILIAQRTPALRSYSRSRAAWSAQQNGRPGKLKKHTRVDSEFGMSALRLCLLVQAVLVVSALAQTPSEQNSALPSQAKQVHGLAVPVPKEIFRSLDQFRDANWSAIKRPEIARWKSHGDQAQIATLLGVAIAEGFIAMEAKDSAEVKTIGNSVLALARGLGVRESALRRSRSIMELADKSEWSEARKEWDGVLSDVETGMIEIKSAHLAQLVSLGGWLRGTEALSALILQNYSPERANLIRQPELINHLEEQLHAMSSDIQAGPLVVKLLDGTKTIRSLVESENGPLSEETVRKVHGVCAELVPLASRRLE